MAPKTRIQARNRAAILDAALEVFSSQGFRGSTVDQIAQTAGLSKPNLLYYFPSKEAIHTALLDQLLDAWLDPLRAIDPNGEPLEVLQGYICRKLVMSRDYPRESRLFANEILQGAPRLGGFLGSDLKPLVDDLAKLIRRWSDEGRIADVHPYHLIFAIWSLTQHYADFDVQVRALLPDAEATDPLAEAERFLLGFFAKGLAPT
jgi:TetR/AcrR family transcriptional regulator